MADVSLQSVGDAVKQANSLLSGQALIPEKVIDLVKRLHQDRQFGLARKVLDHYSEDPRVKGSPQYRLVVAQKRALSTYKDSDLQADAKFERALRILREADDLHQTANQGTLGLAGAISKRLWELTAQARHLETALAYYLRGFHQGVQSDYGYTGINAAFVLDLLAVLENPEAQLPSSSEGLGTQRRTQARTIREALVRILPSLADEPQAAWLHQTWWFLVTLGEAYFGLDNYADAERWLSRAAALQEVPDWERESAARQLAALLGFKHHAAARSGQRVDARAEGVLRMFLGQSYAAVTSVMRGKVGLALSGGGFRAALYHIGVLAKLAECDLLRHVESLSCVSGGSIIGAYFYLLSEQSLLDSDFPGAALTP